MNNIKGIALDFMGVLGKEKYILLDHIDQKLERKFGVLNNDDKFIEWAIKETGLTVKEIRERTKKIIYQLYEIVEPELPNNLKGYKLALATNHLSYLTDWLKEINYLNKFDVIFSSAIVKKEKPNKDYFQTLAQSMKLSPNQILFIDDNLINVEGALSVGFNSFQYNREHGSLKTLLQSFLKKQLP